MKTIIYILIVVMISSIVYSAIPISTSKVQVYKNEIVLESNNKTLSDNELQYSVNIISKRLEDYGIKLFSIYPVADKSQIHINFKKQQNIVEIADLLCQKGELFFIETYSASEMLKNFTENDRIYSLLGINEDLKINSVSPVLGHCQYADADKVGEYLSSGEFRNKVPENALFAWGKITAEKVGLLDLYALKLGEGESKVLDDSAVISASLDLSNEELPGILIKFNETGTAIWGKMTRENLNKEIAIVMDQQVYYSPVVRSEIKGGSCLLSGKFSMDELKVFVSLVKNGKLPVSFKIK